MTGQKVRTILGAVLAFACVANAGFAQTQATAINGTQASGEGQSAAAMAQEIFDGACVVLSGSGGGLQEADHIEGIQVVR